MSGGANLRDLLRRLRHFFTPGCTDKKARHGGSLGGGGGGGGGWGWVRVILYPVRCIARSGRRNVLAMLSIIDVCSRGLSSVDTSVANWFWLGTSKTHLITHSNHLQL